MPPAADSPDVYLALPARPENVAVVRQSIAGVADALDVNHALAADMKTDLRRRLQFWLSPRVATGLRRRTTRPAFNSYSALV